MSIPKPPKEIVVNCSCCGDCCRWAGYLEAVEEIEELMKESKGKTKPLKAYLKSMRKKAHTQANP